MVFSPNGREDLKINILKKHCKVKDIEVELKRQEPSQEMR